MLMKKKGRATRRSVVVPPAETARAIFWQTVKEIVPEVFEELEATPVSELHEWAERWNLDKEWCIEFGESVITRLEKQRRQFGEASVFSAVDDIANVEFLGIFERDVLAREKDAILRCIYNSLNRAIYEDPVWKSLDDPLVFTKDIDVAIESIMRYAEELLEKTFPANGFQRYLQAGRNIRFLVCRRVKRPGMSYGELAKEEIANWSDQQRRDAIATRTARYAVGEVLEESDKERYVLNQEIDKVKKGVKSARELLGFG